jgi:predicted enzyme related to lactoylglutathione lyase
LTVKIYFYNTQIKTRRGEQNLILSPWPVKKIEKGINGAIMKKRDPAQPGVNSIEVKNIEQTIKDIEANRGKIVVPKMAIPSIGWLAYFKDPDDNIHGIMQPDANAK